MKLKLKRIEPVAGNVKSFVFVPEQPISWKPGQYMHYLLPHDDEDDRGHERWFTNSAAPSEDVVMISTRIDQERSSSFKKALSNLKPGDEIVADGPEGDFVIEDPSRNYIFVAGGIGVTPFRSILVEAAKQAQKLNVTLLYANRTNEIPFAEELDKLAQENTNLKNRYLVNPERLDSQLIKKYIDKTQNPVTYISGPEPMVKALAQELKDLGVNDKSIKIDDFPGYETF